MATVDVAAEDDRVSATEIMIRGRSFLASVMGRLADDAEEIQRQLSDSGWPPPPSSTVDVEPASDPTPSNY